MGLPAASTRARTRTESWRVPRKTATRSRRFASITAKGSAEALPDRRAPPRGRSPSPRGRPDRCRSQASIAQADGVERQQVEDGRAPRALTRRPPREGRGRGSRAAPARPRACRRARGWRPGTSRSTSRSDEGGPAFPHRLDGRGRAVHRREGERVDGDHERVGGRGPQRADRGGEGLEVDLGRREEERRRRPRRGEVAVAARRPRRAAACPSASRRPAGAAPPRGGPRPGPPARRSAVGLGHEAEGVAPAVGRPEERGAHAHEVLEGGLAAEAGAPAPLQVEEQGEDRLQVALVLPHHRRAAPRGGRPVDAPHVVSRREVAHAAEEEALAGRGRGHVARGDGRAAPEEGHGLDPRRPAGRPRTARAAPAARRGEEEAQRVEAADRERSHGVEAPLPGDERAVGEDPAVERRQRAQARGRSGGPASPAPNWSSARTKRAAPRPVVLEGHVHGEEVALEGARGQPALDVEAAETAARGEPGEAEQEPPSPRRSRRGRRSRWRSPSRPASRGDRGQEAPPGGGVVH